MVIGVMLSASARFLALAYPSLDLIPAGADKAPAKRAMSTIVFVTNFMLLRCNLL